MDLKLPNLGEGADSGTVVNLFVKEGDEIQKDQPILELENEKAVASIPATASGVVAKIYVKPGDKVAVGARLISVTESGSASPAAESPKKKAPEARPSPQSAETAPEEEMNEETEAHEPPSNGAASAGPPIRKLAADLGLDLSKVRGSAPGGRITLPDVRAYIQKLIRGAAQPKSPTAAP